MQHSKIFIISLFLALSALVAATGSAADDTIVAKREALNARMHQRKLAGHGAMKKRESRLLAWSRFLHALFSMHPD